jgi:acetyl esterase/lipase
LLVAARDAGEALPAAAVLTSPAAAAEAGVDVTLEIGEALPHVYPLMLGTPEAAEATERIGKFLRARVR